MSHSTEHCSISGEMLMQSMQRLLGQMMTGEKDQSIICATVLSYVTIKFLHVVYKLQVSSMIINPFFRYWLYAAIKFKCLLVTNDEMRDHTFQLLGNDFFPRWKERHQVSKAHK